MRKSLTALATDESGQSYTEYLMVTLMIAFAFVGMSRVMIDALARYLRQVYMIVTLPVP